MSRRDFFLNMKKSYLTQPCSIHNCENNMLFIDESVVFSVQEAASKQATESEAKSESEKAE